MRLVVAVPPIALVLVMALGGLPRVAQATTASQPEDLMLSEPLVEDSDFDEGLELEEDGDDEVEPQSDAAIASGVSGTCEWEIDADGILTTFDGYLDAEDFKCNVVEKYKDRIKSVRTSGSAVVVDSFDSSPEPERPASLALMFINCSSLTSLDLTGWDTSSVEDMGHMFSGCSSLTSLDLSGWDTSSATRMTETFAGCVSLSSLDLSGWDTSSVTSMEGMLGGCSSLTSLDLSGWDTSSVIRMGVMFSGCSSLTSLDLSGWDTSSVVYTSSMFGSCSSLTSLDLSGWDTSSVTSMGGMLGGCSSLTPLNISGWDTSSVTEMPGVFSGCSSLTSLDLSSWDTSSVEGMSYMFSGCSSLTSLDLSGWDTSSATYMDHMFDSCGSLARIRVGSKCNFGTGFPAATASNGKWFSQTAQKWFTTGEIASSRSGIADTYVNTRSVSSLSITAPAAQTYTGKALTPAPVVKDGSLTLKKGTDYTLKYANNVNAGTAKVTVTGIGNYTGSVTKTFTIAKAAQAISAANKSVAMGKTVKLDAKRAKGNGKLTYKSSNTKIAKVSATGVVTPVKVGKATITITASATANYKAATKKVTVTVAKGTQPMVPKAVARTASLKTLKTKAVTVARPLSFTKAPQGKVTYAKASGSSAALTINKTTGKVTVRKGTKKGTYTIKVKVTAAGNANYKAGSKTLTCKVVVK